MTDPIDVLVILAMAAATLACRWLGFFVMGFVPLTPRVRRGLEALPGAVVASIVLPGAAAAGLAGLAAVAAAIATMWATRRDVLALAAGCGLAAAVRFVGG
jgi:uncharacterized membrane protein